MLVCKVAFIFVVWGVADGRRTLRTSKPHIDEIEDIKVPCAEGQSFISTLDLKKLIIFVADKLQIMKTINESVFLNAKSMHDVHLRSIEDFKSRLEAQPKHFKHILEDLASTRQNLLTMIAALTITIDEFEPIELLINGTLNDVDQSLARLNRTKEICKINQCSEEKMTLQTRSRKVPLRLNIRRAISENDGYCAPLMEVNKIVKDALLDYSHNMIDTMKNQIHNDNSEYDIKVSNVVKTVIDLAVNKFGTTMFHILMIQDEYYHLKRDVHGNTVISDIDRIKENNLKMQLKLLELEKAINNYDLYCKNCNKQKLVFRLLSLEDEVYYDPEHNPKSILEQMLFEFFNETTKELQEAYSNIFKDLNELLNEDLQVNYIDNLILIHDEVTQDVLHESELLKEVNISIPWTSISSISKLLALSNDALLTIDDNLRSLHPTEGWI